jgi:RimJ/RimL family protein N-acetyltransferase
MTAAVLRLKLFGHANAMVWTLKDNARARRFYERLGGRPLGERQERIGGVDLAEVAYGWPAIERLLETCYDRLSVP